MRANERRPAGNGAAAEQTSAEVTTSVPRATDTRPQHVTRESVIAAGEWLAACGLDSELTDAVLWRLWLEAAA